MVKGLSRDEVRTKFGIEFTKPSLTKQAHKAECDINVIVDRYVKAGVSLEHANAVQGFFDAASVPDFQSAMNIVAESTELFFNLPARVRKAFDNDTSKFVQYFEDPNDLLLNQMLVDYNLLTPRTDSSGFTGSKKDALATPLPESGSKPSEGA